MRRTLLCAESAGFWHIGVRMMLVEELNGMESAAVDVEVEIPAVEIWGAGFPDFNLWMHGLYGFPDGQASILTGLCQSEEHRPKDAFCRYADR